MAGQQIAECTTTQDAPSWLCYQGRRHRRNQVDPEESEYVSKSLRVRRRLCALTAFSLRAIESELAQQSFTTSLEKHRMLCGHIRQWIDPPKKMTKSQVGSFNCSVLISL